MWPGTQVSGQSPPTGEPSSSLSLEKIALEQKCPVETAAKEIKLIRVWDLETKDPQTLTVQG